MESEAQDSVSEEYKLIEVACDVDCPICNVDADEIATTNNKTVEEGCGIPLENKLLNGIEGDQFLFEATVVREKVKSLLKDMRNNNITLDKYHLCITKNDLKSAVPPNWLTDGVIDFYMKLLEERSEQNERLPSLYCFSSLFLVALNSRKFEGIRKWTKKIDIFSRELLIIPVHRDAHWCLSIVDFKYKLILYFDSIGAKNDECLKMIFRYLRKEHIDKHGTAFDFADWKLQNATGIPLQNNNNDCGVFACTFAEYYSRRATFDFEQSAMKAFRWKIIYEILTTKLSNNHWIEL